jgi:hypothetical protein
MALSSRMHNRSGPVGLENAFKPSRVADVGPLEDIARRVGSAGQRIKVCGVCQLVEIDDNEASASAK